MKNPWTFRTYPKIIGRFSVSHGFPEFSDRFLVRLPQFLAQKIKSKPMLGRFSATNGKAGSSRILVALPPKSGWGWAQDALGSN